MRMYEVTAKCGHVGRNYFTVKTFAIIAESKKEAAAIIKQTPRVKHDRKDAIMSVEIIDSPRFNDLFHQNQADPYFSSFCIQDQRALGYMDRIREECDVQAEREAPIHQLYYRKKALRNAKKYLNNYIDLERYAV